MKIKSKESRIADAGQDEAELNILRVKEERATLKKLKAEDKLAEVKL